MTAPLSAERVKELREWVLYNKGWSNKRNDLLAILSDYSSMRAESERLREDFEYKNEQLGSALIRVEKAEAELERLKEDCDRTADVVVEQMAQLAKQTPLIQAVMGLDEIDFIADDWPSEKLRESADKLRSEK